MSGRSARKGCNLERDPRYAISLSTTSYDVVVEATAELVTDSTVVAAAAERYAAAGWPCEGRRVRHGAHGRRTARRRPAWTFDR